MMDDIAKQSLRGLWQSSTLADGNMSYLEQLYEDYLQDPDAVDSDWRQYFESLPKVNGGAIDTPHSQIRNYFRDYVRHKPAAYEQQAETVADLAQERKQVKVLQLINAHRYRGHQEAMINPLEDKPSVDIPELHLSYHGLSTEDLDTVFDTGSLVGPKRASLRTILDIVRSTYCGPIGAEYMHITDTKEKRWIQNRLESEKGHLMLTKREKLRLLDRLIAAEGMEHYLHTRYIGQKRFSLEGAESLIPLLDEILQRGGSHKIKEIGIGMAHRGRLNVLINILGKTPAELFLEFEGKKEGIQSGSGDVKYHQGFSSNIQTDGGPIHVALAFNPSHLEIVGPVVEGSVRARQDKRHDKTGQQVLPVLIHGDAAFAGQGVVMETFNMSHSRGFSTKGTIHIVINNQIGFTTSSQREARSTYYCTDVAKMVNAPILHVNGDNPEAVLFVVQVALDYRMRFRKDVVIDLVCYRRHGHSEADEPMATQPMMYTKIKEKATTCTLYGQQLTDEAITSEAEINSRQDNYRNALDSGNPVALNLLRIDIDPQNPLSQWQPYLAVDETEQVNTTISLPDLRRLADSLDKRPAGFELHSAVAKIFDNRRKMAAGALPIDWGFAEAMAFAALVDEGHHIRISGQDSGRGTFFHRHAVIHNQLDGHTYVPLCHVSEDQGNFRVINSLLSEEAVLAFEYGYATTTPDTLVIWEAQFGDFANNAQVVIDQFISAGEQKWDRLCGLVLLLPHAYEGQGPEHSSARLERYMQLCAEKNIQVCVPSTASQIFHLLRRQMIRRLRKPLIVMTPKSLLRHRLAVSSLEDLTQGEFNTVLPEMDDIDDKQVKRVILCSGRVFYDLLERRRQEQRNDVAIIRMEQLYPFPLETLRAELSRYPQAIRIVWCQEEPKNQGAWYTSQHHVRSLLTDKQNLEYAGRSASAAPAVGYPALHVQQLHELLAAALGTAEEI